MKPINSLLRNFFRKIIYFFLLILFCSALFTSNLSADRLSRKLVHSDGISVWFAFPGKLLKQGEELDEWSWVSSEHGMNGGKIKFFKIDDNIIWIATYDGLLNSDIRYNDWRNYGTEQGFPSSDINDMSFSDEYIWVATTKGIVRMDKYVDEITSYGSEHGIGTENITAIYAGEKYVWAGSDKGIYRFDLEFETWRNFYKQEEFKDFIVEDIFRFDDYIWFLTESCLIRYDEKNEAYKIFDDKLGFPCIRPVEIFLFQDEIYALAGEKISIYKSSLDAWSPFQFMDELPSKMVSSLIVDDEFLWFATEKGISRFTKSNGEWLQLNVSSGLLEDKINLLYKGNNYIYAISEKGISYLDIRNDTWKIKEISLKASEESKSIKGKQLLPFRMTSDGLEIGPSLGKNCIFSGRYSLFFNNYGEFGGFNSALSHDFHALALVNAELGKSRKLNGFYDNTSVDETLYGMTFRGAWEDHLRFANIGFFSAYFQESMILSPISIEGVNIALEAGKRHEIIQRRSLRIESFWGLRKGESEVEIFKGNLRTHESFIPSKNYIKKVFFHLHELEVELPLKSDSEVIMLKVNPAQYGGTYEIIKDRTVAGIVGSWIKLIPGIDYFMDYSDGIVMFASPAAISDTIAASYIAQTGYREVLLYGQEGENVSHELQTRYQLGASDISPTGFSLEIFDSLGTQVPLNEVGLDLDDDKNLDSETIDFKNGYLTLSGIKNPIKGKKYIIHVKFNTRTQNVNLTHEKIIKNSEKVLIDGIPAGQTVDYLMVYPTGKIIFVNDDLIGEESIIEIKYEYELPESSAREKIAGIHTVFSPGDFLSFDFGYTYIGERKKADSSNSQFGNLTPGKNFFNVSGEYYFLRNEKNMSLKIRPELVLEKISTNEFKDAEGGTIAARWDKLEFSTGVQKFDPDFGGTGLRIKETGIINSTHYGEVGYRLFPWLPVKGSWNFEWADDLINKFENRKKEYKGNILISKGELPKLSLNILDKNMLHFELNHREKRINVNFDYEMQKNLIQRLHINRLRLLSMLRKSYFNDNGRNGIQFSRSRDFYFGTKFSPIEAWSFNTDYKNFTLWNKVENEFTKFRVLHDLELNSVSDIFGGISTSAFFKGIYNNYLVDISKKKYNTSLDYRGNLSINFYPGDWLDLFEPLLFNVSVSDTRSEYIEQIPKNENAFDLIDKPQNIRGSRTRGYLYKGTLYPALLPLNFTQTFQHNKTTSRIYETFTIKSYKRYYSKLELFPRKPSKVIGDLLQVFEETIHSEKKVEKVPSLTFDSLLSSSLLVKLKIRMDIQEIKQGIKSQNYIDVEPTVRIVYRIRTIPKFGRFDLTLEGKISYSYENHEYYGAAWKNLIQSEWWFQKNLYALFTFTFKDEFGEYNKPVSYSTNLKFNFVF